MAGVTDWTPYVCDLRVSDLQVTVSGQRVESSNEEDDGYWMCRVHFSYETKLVLRRAAELAQREQATADRLTRFRGDMCEADFTKLVKDVLRVTLRGEGCQALYPWETGCGFVPGLAYHLCSGLGIKLPSPLGIASQIGSRTPPN